MRGGSQPTPEFSRIVDVSSIGERTLMRDIAATPAERAALAARFGLHSLAQLSAAVTVRRRGARLIELAGEFQAELEQVCVVTLDPVPVSLSRRFRQAYSPDLPQDGAGEVIVAGGEEEDDPEPLVGVQIDLGEAVAQQLAVALDPYPRRADATLPAACAPASEPPAQGSAFAALAALRKG
jgi:hypothetical protein